MPVKVLTDSSCDLTEAECSALGIEVVPLSVRFGAEELTDRVDLTPETFFEKMAATPTLPETAAPSPGAFEQAFRAALDGGADGVVCINIASGLSATYQSALNAAKAIDGDNVRVVDSRSVSWGLGSVVVRCAERARDGATIDEVVGLAANMIPRTRVFATLDTLENLKKGGRIGGAKALVGTMLSVKPIIQVGDQVHEHAKPRTRSKALRQLADIVRDAGAIENLSVMHGLAPDVDELVEMLAEIVPKDEIGVRLIGATIGVHGGPRVTGVAFQVVETAGASIPSYSPGYGRPAVPETTTASEGALIGGRYRLVTKLARGGMAEVWEAKDEVLSRPVAVKTLLPHLVADESFHVRFHREALAAARLSHPHIVSIYDTCSSEDFEAIVMELVRGSTLRQVLDDRGALPPRRAVSIARQVADALGHAHAGGLVHRDVKPGNILLADDGRVLVTDFGIAKAAEDVSDLTDAGQIVGTAKYLSPEQVQGGAVDARTDLYALGVVLYEMLCGRPPFSGDSPTATALARLTTEPLRPRQVRAGISRSLDDVVMKAMARAPEGRFQSAADLCAALDGLDLRVDDDDETVNRPAPVAPAVTEDPTPAPSGPLAFARAERSWLVPTALIVVIAVVLGIVGVVLGGTDVGRDLFDAATGKDEDAAPSGGPLPLGQPQSHDPEGDGSENDDELSLAVDGDAGTAWTTDSYETRSLGGLKPGVGIIVPLAAVAEVHELAVTSPTQDWRASVYVADSPGGDWGAAITSLSNIPGSATFDLGGVPAGAVLLWITDLGDGSTGRPFEVAVAEVAVS